MLVKNTEIKSTHTKVHRELTWLDQPIPISTDDSIFRIPIYHIENIIEDRNPGRDPGGAPSQ